LPTPFSHFRSHAEAGNAAETSPSGLASRRRDTRFEVRQPADARMQFFFHKWLARPEKPGYHFVLGNNATTGP